MIRRRRKTTPFVRSVWVMLTVFFSLLLVFLCVGTSIAKDNAAPINSMFGIEASKKVTTGDGDEDLDWYKSDYIERDASGEIVYMPDGNGNKTTNRDDAAMRRNSELVGEQTAVEGSVLLWNNDALPLKSGAKVSMFGIASQKYMFGGSGSGQVDVTPVHGTISAALTAKGVKVNTKLEERYKKIAAKYGGQSGYTNTAASNYLPWFKVGEAPYSEIKDVAESTVTADDTAVMIISRTAGEDFDISEDVRDNMVGGVKNYLELSVEEAGVLENLQALKAAGGLKKTVLLLDTANPMQFSEISKEEYGVDACIWIGQGGTMSFAQIADVLVGHDEFVMSGRATDTLLYNNHSAPSDANFGDFTWTEHSNKLPDLDKEYGSYYWTHNTKYIVYQEGVYVGYRYYETRYEDTVLGVEGATSAAGATDKKAWDYNKEVAFPFGYGLSYTTFEHSNFKVTETETGYDVSLDIRNSGSVAGKEVMQVYIQRPYTEYDKQNGIEKPAIELVGFAKTDRLTANADGKQTLTVSVDKEAFRTYDAYGKRTYILEEGDYYLAVGNNAHDALNNILAAKDLTAEQKARMDAPGNAAMAHKITVAQPDYEVFSKSAETEKEITNRFDDADLNLYEGTKDDQSISYLSRNDWEGTFPTAAVALKCVNDIMVRDMQYGHTVAVAEGDKLPVYGKVTSPNGELSLAMMKDLEYDDPQWDHLLNQMTLKEQNLMVSVGLGYLAAAESVGAPGGTATDGPAGVRSSKYAFPSPVVMAATWNVELMERVGDAMGHEAMHRNFNLIWAPGADIHRNPYGGRNWEYYSEDGVLSGLMLAAEVKGIQGVGVIVMTKHFAFNDQERNRYGVATFFNEQSARDIYLRAFESAVRDSKMNGVMSSFNRVGLTWAGAHKGLLTDVLRDEWNFIGVVETDACNGKDSPFHMLDQNARAEGIVAGNDLWLSGGNENFLDEHKKNATVMQAMREACHRILYTQLHSSVMNGVSVNTRIISITPWWETLLVSLCVVVGVCLLASIAMCALSFVFATARYKAFAARRAEEKKARGGGNRLKPLHRNLIVICSCVVGVGLLLTAILVPTLNKGSGAPPPKPHVCQSICEVCGKCTNIDCEDEKCADKCGGEKQTYAFEAENAVLVGTAGPLSIEGEAPGRVVVAGLNNNKGASVTFVVDAPVDTVASLVVTVSRRDRPTKFTSTMGVSVNGGEYIKRSTTVTTVSSDDEWKEASYARYNLGCISLAAGQNTISFTVLGDGAYSGYNFDKIELLCEDPLEEGHMCASACPSCGKCTDEECQDEACAEKCSCAVDFEAENAEYRNGQAQWGYLEVFTNEQGRTVVKNFNGNVGANITFKVYVDGEPGETFETDLYVVVSRFKIDTVFTDNIEVTVNGGEPISSDTVIKGFSGAEWSDESYGEFFIGKITLNAGANTISFTVLGGGETGGYNFDKITLRNAPPVLHECSDKCEVCGGCTTDCDNGGCAEKCECDNVTESVTLEAEDDTTTTYADGPGEHQPWAVLHKEPSEPAPGDKVWIAGFNENVGAWIEFAYTSDAERDALLFVSVSRRKSKTTFSDWVETRLTYPDGTSIEIVSKATLDAHDNEWSAEAFTEIMLGKVRLKKGVNKIRFTIKTYEESSQLGGYNFDAIRLGLMGEGVTPEPVEHDITVASGITGGTVSVSATKATAGTEITVTVTPDEGYVLKNLKYNGIDITATKKFVMPDADVTVTAQFVDESTPPAPTYTLSFDENGGEGDIVGVGTSYEEGETFDLPSGDGLKKEGHYFVCWTYDGNDYEAGASFTMPATDVTFVAKWAAKLPDAVFEAEDAELKDGTRDDLEAWAHVGTEEVKVDGVVTRVVAKGFNTNINAEVTYKIFVNGAAGKKYTAELVSINSSIQAYDVKFTDIIGVRINGAEYTSEAIMPQSWDQWADASYKEVVLGDIELTAGINTITFWIKTADDGKGCNFDKIILRDPRAEMTWTKVKLEAEDAAFVDGPVHPWGELKVEDIAMSWGDVDGKWVSGFNNNIDAYIEFTYTAAADCQADLILRLNKRSVQTVFSDWVDTVVTYADGSTQTVAGNVTIEAMENAGLQWKGDALTEIDLGTIQLKKGENKIRFTTKAYDTTNDVGGYNYDYIMLNLK